MITLLCVLVLNYLVSTQATSKSKSVNLALETVLEFDKKDIPTDVKIIDNVQKFLAKVRGILDQSANSRRSNRGSIKFTDFVENTLIILRTFSDEDLEELVAVVDDELRKYHYKGCKFYELVLNDDFRKYVTNNLELMRNTPAKQLKKIINNTQKKLQNKSFNEDETAFIEYINSLYSGNASENMYNVLQNLQQYNTGSKRSNNDLQKIVKDAVRSVVFDHYSNLNVNARRDLRIKVATYLIDYSAKDKKMNASFVKFSTVQVDDVVMEAVTPDRSLVKNVNEKVQPFRELANESVAVATEATTKWRPFMTLYPEEIIESKASKKKRKRSKRKKTSPMPMQTLWEEDSVTRKKPVEDQPKTKKTKHSKRGKNKTNKPGKEIQIFSEHNAVIIIKSTHLPSVISKKKKHKHKHRHGKRHKSKKTTASDKPSSAETKASTKKKSSKRASSKERTASKEESDEKTTKIQPIRKAFDKSMDGEGLSIEMSYPRRFLSEKNKVLLGKRSQRRREELRLRRRSRNNFTFPTISTFKRVKLKRRFKTVTPSLTDSTASTPDSNFILKKIDIIEKELEDMKHRIDVTSTFTAKVTAATDLPFWVRQKDNFKTKRGVMITATTESSEYEEETENTIKKVTTIPPKNVTLANFSMSPTTKAIATKLTTNLTTTIPTNTTTPSTTTVASTLPTSTTIASIVFRSSDNSTFLPVILHKNKTIANKLKPVVEFAENVNHNVIDNMIIKENEIKNNQSEIQKKGNIKFEIKDKNVNISVNSINTTKKDGAKSTMKEFKKTTSGQEVQTLSFFNLHKIVEKSPQNDTIGPNVKPVNKTRRLNFLSPDCDNLEPSVRTFKPRYLNKL